MLVLQAALEEKARLARTRELETARLRALQERAQDRQSQLDELRAQRSFSSRVLLFERPTMWPLAGEQVTLRKRASRSLCRLLNLRDKGQMKLVAGRSIAGQALCRWQEAAARRDREQERATLERAGQQQKAIADARHAQAASKVLVQAAMAKVEEADFQAALAKARAEQQALRAQVCGLGVLSHLVLMAAATTTPFALQEAEQAAAKKAHLAHLQKQVEANEQAKQAAKAAHMAEGQKIKEFLEREKAIHRGEPDVVDLLLFWDIGSQTPLPHAVSAGHPAKEAAAIGGRWGPSKVQDGACSGELCEG